MKLYFSVIMLLVSTCLFAQSDSVQEKLATNPLTFSGYVEVYYTYDFNKPADNNRPGFVYSHNRHNEFNLNLGFLKANYTTERIRANLAIATGTYMNANYASEEGVLKNIYEANAGIKISKKKNIWVDAGIFASHIGFESAVSKDCWSVTRSIVADNSPYFESGAKLTYTSDNNKWILCGLLLNGWQRITRVSDNSLMSFGTQLQYVPSKNLLFNYSTFIGTDKPDSSRKMRYYQNLYSVISIGKWGILPAFDIGMEQKEKGGNAMNVWIAPVLRVRYALNDQWKVAVRGEYYADKKGVIISTNTLNGFKTTGLTFNVDYAPIPNALIRIEARTLMSKDDVFVKRTTTEKNNHFLTGSLAISF